MMKYIDRKYGLTIFKNGNWWELYQETEEGTKLLASSRKSEDIKELYNKTVNAINDDKMLNLLGRLK